MNSTNIPGAKMACEYKLVNRKKKRGKKSQSGPKKKLNELRYDIEVCDFFKDTCKHVGTQPETDLVCYGLGNFADSYIARYQLAFLLALRENLQIPPDRCEIYDPMFTKEEKDVLSSYDFNVVDENQEGKRPCNRRTVFYMPHCGKALYNNLLWSNWGPQLANLVLVGNSFTQMMDRTPSRLLHQTANYVIKIQPYTHEIPLDIPQQYEDVFNDTSIHTFLTNTEQEAPRELWENNQEPKYDVEDAEIVLR